MVLTEEERKQRRKESIKKWRENNKDYYQKNKEKYKNRYDNEKEKEYRENNKEKIKEKKKRYSKTPKGKKTNMINSWRFSGLIHDDYSELYDKYLNTTECDVCKYLFDETNWRCMDHDHTTGMFRQFLCQRCNMFDNWKKV
jgi:hypothetical protein